MEFFFTAYDDSTKDDSIRAMLHNRAPIRLIKEALGVGQARIDRARLTPRGTCCIRKRGPARKATPAIRALIEAETLMDGSVHDEQLAGKVHHLTGVSLSHDTVRRVRHELGFVFRPRMSIQALSETQKKQRLEFCHWALSNGGTSFDFEKIVFSDESRFSDDPDNSWCYIRRGEWNENVMTAKKKFTKGVMCFGAIGIGFKSKLVVCRGTVNSDSYLANLMESGAIAEMDRRHGQFKWLLMEDGATCHTSRQTMEWMRQNVNLLPGWPANSPDLNPIEMLWALIKRKRHQMAGTIEEQVIAVWDSISQETIDNLCHSFRHRCEMVVKVAGASISQFLSSHKEPTGQLSDSDGLGYPCEVENELMRLVELGATDLKNLDLQKCGAISRQELSRRFKVLRERAEMAKQFRRLPGIATFQWNGPPPEDNDQHS